MKDKMDQDYTPLTNAIRELPDEISPERDLWPEIQSKLSAARVVKFPRGEHHSARYPRLSRRSVLWGTAAAMSLIAATAVITAHLVKTENPALTDASTYEHFAPTPGFAIFASYERTAEELSDLLSKRASRLDPSTREVLERSLLTIDEALEEVRKALADDPESQENRAFGESVWRQKIELLRRANSVAVDFRES